MFTLSTNSHDNPDSYREWKPYFDTLRQDQGSQLSTRMTIKKTII